MNNTTAIIWVLECCVPVYLNIDPNDVKQIFLWNATQCNSHMKPAIKYREYYDWKLTNKTEKVKNFINCNNTKVNLKCNVCYI